MPTPALPAAPAEVRLSARRMPSEPLLAGGLGLLGLVALAIAPLADLSRFAGSGWRLPLLIAGIGLVAAALRLQQRAQTDIDGQRRRLDERRADLLTMCETADLGIAWLDANGHFVAVNDAYAKRIHRPPEALIGQPALTISNRPQHARARQALREIMAGAKVYHASIRQVTDNYYIRTHVLARPASDGRYGRRHGRRFLLLNEDITREQLIGQSLQENDDQLQASEAWLRAIFDNAPIGIGWLTLDGRVAQVNARYAEICHTQPEALVGRMMRATGAAHPEEGLLADQLLDDLIAGRRDQFQHELRLTHPNGETMWLRHTAGLSGSRDDDRTCLISIVEEISHLKEAEAAARRLALYDTLTALPNRRLLLERLDQCLGRAERQGQVSALLFIDLDNFKHLNDARGHHVGDALLCEIGQRLRTALREQDTVARLGGDEFIALLENLGSNRASATVAVSRIAGKVRQAVTQPFQLEHATHGPTASIGITLFSGAEGRSSNELLKEADTAMYRAKRQRDSIAFYSPELQLAAERRLTLERDLHLALGRDQFELLLQPQFTEAGTVNGAEALLRWRHPEHGTVGPGEFLPIAEEAGLGLQIGSWVLREACRVLARLQRHNAHVIAVNLSPRQIGAPRFVRSLEAILIETGANPNLLTLEINEELLRELGSSVHEHLAQLHALGVRLSVDDFGTGYSSLAYLKRLPLDEIKIERTFVADLPDDDSGAAIVEAILAMATHLGLEVVAEGVESEAQLNFLRERGCRRFQGYLLAAPMATDLYLNMFERAPGRH